MKNMKKICLTLCSAVLLVSLASCGEGSRTHKGSKKTLTYLVSVESTAYKTILDQLISEFNETIAEDGYELVPEVPGGEYYQALGTKISAGATPDIFMMELGYFNAYAPLMAPLDEYLATSEKLKTTDLWDLNDNYKDNGKYKALIKDFSPDFMLIYNKTMLDRYNTANPDKQITISETEPLTWTEFYEISSTIQNSQNCDYGTSLGFEPVKHLHEWVQSTGSSMYTSDFKQLNITDSNVQAAFNFFCALQKDNASTEEFPLYAPLNKSSNKKSPASYTSGSNTSEQELFKQQRTFSIFNGLYSFTAFDFYSVPFELGIAPSPVMSKTSTPYSTTSAMVSHAISATSKHKNIAWKWLEYYQTEGLSRFAKVAFNIPGNKTIAGSDAFLKIEGVANAEKMTKMTNYFYNYVNQGYVHATQYNPYVDFAKVNTCFSSQFGKFYDKTNALTFAKLLEEINKSVKGSITTGV